MKKKRAYDITHKVIRVRAGDYALLTEISRQLNLPMAEALHLVITEQAKREQVTIIPHTQIPKPAFEVTAPVALRVRLQPTIATNGSKGAAFRIKPKGARYD